MLGGFLGGLANLGTAYGGYLGAQNQYLQNQQRQQYLQSLQDQQQILAGLPALARGGAFSPLPMQAQPSTATPGTTPTPSPLQPLTPTPVQAQPLPAPSSPLQQAAAGPLNLGGIPGGGPLGIPSLPGMSGFGGGATPVNQAQSGGGMGVSPFGPGQGFTTPTGPRQASLEGFGGTASLGLPRALPLPDYTISQTADPGLGPPPGQDTVFMGVSTFGPPQLQGLGDGGGIVQPAGGFGLPPQYPAQAPAMPGPAGPQTAAITSPTQPAYDQATGRFRQVPRPSGPDTAVPGTADRGLPAQLPADGTRAQTAAGQGGYGQIIRLESGGNMNIGRGSYGEIGPAQILPATFKTYAQPGEDINDPQTNIAVGRRYYDDLLNKSNGDYAAALVGYNRGEEAMRRFQAAGDNLDVLRGTGMMPAAAYQNAIRAAGGRGGSSFDTAHTEMSGNLSPEQHGIGNRGALMMLSRLPQIPQAVRMMDPRQVAQLIDQSYPGASDAVKGAVFLKVLPLMNEIAKEQTAEAWTNWKGQMEQFGFVQKEEDIAEQRAERRSEFQQRQEELRIYHAQTGEKGGQVWQDPQSGKSYWVAGGRVQPLEGLPAAAVRPSAAGTPAVQESVKLYEKLEADKLRGDEAAVKQDQQAIDDWNRAQGKGISGRQSAVMAARQGLLQQHPEWAGREDLIQDALGEYKRLQSIDSSFGGGILGRNVVSLNTVAAHAQTVRQAFEDLDTGNIQRFNQLAQQVAVETGQEAPTDFAAAYSIMAGEVVRLLTTTGGTEGDRNHFQSLLQARFSQAQGRGALRVFDEMIDARFESLEQQYSSIGGPEQQETRRQRFRNRILSDDARALHSRVQKANEQARKLTTPDETPAAGASPAEGLAGKDLSTMSDDEILRGLGQRP